jgi:hypothetical protein
MTLAMINRLSAGGLWRGDDCEEEGLRAEGEAETGGEAEKVQ